MDDRRLTNLIRLAMEAEAFEADVNRPAGLRLVESTPEERAALVRVTPSVRPSVFSLRRIGTGFALAACAALGWFLYPQTVTTAPNAGPKQPVVASGQSNPGQGYQRASKPWLPSRRSADNVLVSGAADRVPGDAADAGDEVVCVVVAIFKGDQGDCRCVHIQPHAWADGRSLDERDPTDLFDVSLKNTCGPVGDSLLLVAVEGPRKMLPRSASEAEALADCVQEAPMVCGGSPGCVASLARGCLPPNVRVLAQSVQLASR